MSRPSAGRDLLFGLLALQNNFIDRDALVDAFHRRTTEPGRALDAILVERGALSPSLHSILEALVDEHIRRHGGDPQQSLAALNSIGSARDELAQVADPDVQASLAIVATARLDDDPDRTIGQADFGESTSTGSRFRILRPHARGGLGQVSVAIDRELDRPVALKEIQDRHADEPNSRARFVQEGQITGKLEHPGIVPVYGLGHDSTGRPFYAMRFIRGDSLQDAMRSYHADESLRRDPIRRVSRLRELLRRFTDVCNAIAYAHSRGVLHRDLKPGNIMLGPFGETLVVDWGLAKPVGEASGEAGALDEPVRLSGEGNSSSETMPGTTIGTPAFASPEQAIGDLKRLGPATDIYGLGATLYAVLTGRPPVEGADRFEVIARVERGEIPPARSIDPAIPAALEAICRKAMALRPEDRYESARALAADVARWLDDEPVSVHREPLSARAGRWVRQHRTLMSGAAAAAAMGLVGLTVLAIAQDQYNRALRQANGATKQALAAETEAKKEAEEANERTKQALTRSEQDRNRAEAVLGFLREDVLAAARPEGQDGGLGISVTVRRAVDAAEPKIAERFKDQPLVEADVRSTLGTTYTYLREAALAIRQFQRVVEIQRAKLDSDHPDTLTSRNNLAEAYRDAGRTAEAIGLFEEVLKARGSKLGPEHPETLATRHYLAKAYQDAGRIEESVTLFEAVLKAFDRRLGPDHPTTLSARNNLAEAYRDAGRNEEATKLFEAVLRARESRSGPDHPATLAIRNNLACAYRDAGRIPEAIGMFEGVLKAKEAKLGPDHPDTLATRHNLAYTYRDAGRNEEAIALLEAVLEAFDRKLGPDHPDSLATRSNLAYTYHVGGRTAEATKRLEAVLKAEEAKLGPDHPATLITRHNLALVYRDAGRTAEAIGLFEAVLKAKEAKLGPDHPETLTTRSTLAGALGDAGRSAEAIGLFEAVLKAEEIKLGFDHPSTLSARHNLACAYRDADRIPEAIELFEAVLKAKETKLGLDHPDTFTVRNNLAEAYEEEGRFEQAERLRRADVDQARRRLGPADPRTAGALAVLGRNLHNQEKWPESEPILRECLSVREKAMPDDWPTFNTRSMLGASLAGQQKYAEAEPLLVSGYEGMKAREAKIPAVGKTRITEAVERLVKLYEAWGKPQKADDWRARLPKKPAASKPGP